MDDNKIVAVKCEGCFTEWYSPFYTDLYEDNAEFRHCYDEGELRDVLVIGPSLGDAEHEYLSGDLGCLTDRLCVDVGMAAWEDAKGKLADAIEGAIADGKQRTFTYEGMHDVRIIPCTKSELPPVNEKSLEVYGDFKELVRERVAALCR